MDLSFIKTDPKYFLSLLNNTWRLLVIVVGLLIVRKAVFFFVDRLFSDNNVRKASYLHERRLRTLNPLLKSIAGYVIYFVGIVSVLTVFGIAIGPIIATAGLASLAVGFGAQNLVRDVISGFFILFEDQFAVGDYVSLAGVSGTVEEMGLRTTRIRDNGGQIYIIPNGEIKQVTNFMGEKMRVLVDVTFPIKEPLDRTLAVLNDVVDKAHAEIDSFVDKPCILGITRLSETSYDVSIIGYTKPMRQWAAERALRDMIKRAAERESSAGA